MPSFPADPRRFSWSNPSGRSRGHYRPNGRLNYYGWRANPPLWDDSTGIYAARLFVGLAVDKEQAWEEDDVVRIVKRVRTKQTGQPDASFIAQRGLYTQTIDGETVVVDEPSIQIIVLNLPHFNVTQSRFEGQMVELAEVLARDLEQREVIVEIQKSGIAQKTIGVGP